MCRSQTINHEEQNNIDYENATHCRLCEKIFEENEKICKVRDHCHSEYRGAEHKTCNLKLNQTKHQSLLYSTTSNVITAVM